MVTKAAADPAAGSGGGYSLTNVAIGVACGLLANLVFVTSSNVVKTSHAPAAELCFLKGTLNHL